MSNSWGVSGAEPQKREEAMTIENEKTLVTIRLRGGDASDARDAIAVDLDLGTVTDGAEWSALVERAALETLLNNTGASMVGEPLPWDGSRFGDGHGTVERVDGRIVGEGCYAR